MPALHPKNQIPLNWLSKNALPTFERLSPWFAEHKSKNISDTELVAIILLVFCQAWRGKLWFGGKNPELQNNVTASRVKLTDVFLPEILNKDLAQIDILTFFARHLLRGVSLRVNRALTAWHERKINVLLRFEIPTPYEILAHQTKGQRVVTVFNKPDDYLTYHFGKDPFTFVIHDLEHADEFFHENQNHHEQILFYKKIKADIDTGKFEKELSTNSNFKEDFEYVIADMNSHPAHLQATLDAIIKKHSAPVSKQTPTPTPTQN